MNQSYFDLNALLDHFIDIGEITQHKTLQLEKIEALLEPVGKGLNKFSPKHLKIIKDPEEKYWKFLNWWNIPLIEDSQYEILGNTLLQMNPSDPTIVVKLNRIIKNIEIVSCILRFIDPNNFGIFSPPVETLLSIRGNNPENKYFHYLRSLRSLQKEYEFTRIADVDMALWVLSNILNYSKIRLIPKYRKIYESYVNSVNPVKLLMAKNSLEQIWSEKQYLNIAELFLDTDLKVAGILASRELERMVKEKCISDGIDLIEKEISPTRKPKSREFMNLIEDLANKNELLKSYRRDIRTWRRIRATLLHELEEDVSYEEVAGMINGIREVMSYLK